MFKAAAIYFGIVFCVGFVLGPIRELLLVPRVGQRVAQFIEFPLMLVAMVLAARWISKRFCEDLNSWQRIGVGCIATLLVLAADLAVGVGLRKLSVVEVFTDKDPIAGSVYYVLLIVFAGLPWLFGRAARCLRVKEQ